MMQCDEQGYIYVVTETDEYDISQSHDDSEQGSVHPSAGEFKIFNF